MPSLSLQHVLLLSRSSTVQFSPGQPVVRVIGVTNRAQERRDVGLLPDGGRRLVSLAPEINDVG